MPTCVNAEARGRHLPLSFFSLIPLDRVFYWTWSLLPRLTGLCSPGIILPCLLLLCSPEGTSMHGHAWPFPTGDRILRSGIHACTAVLTTAQSPQSPEEVSVLLHVFLETTALSFVEEILSKSFLTWKELDRLLLRKAGKLLSLIVWAWNFPTSRFHHFYSSCHFPISFLFFVFVLVLLLLLLLLFWDSVILCIPGCLWLCDLGHSHSVEIFCLWPPTCRNHRHELPHLA